MDGGRGGRFGYHGGGGGRHNRNRRGGRGRGFRHQPYNNRSRGPRHGRGNRFGAGQNYQDPQTMMIRQVSSFVSRVGEFKNLKESPLPEVRSVVFTTAANINDLTTVLCAEDKLEMLLKFRSNHPIDGFEPNPIHTNIDETVGKLVHVVVSCVSGLPMQTPCYAALTLAVHERVKGTQYEGFAQRCVKYSMIHIARDLDTILMLGKDQARAWCRTKLLVRYLAILGRMGVVKGYGEETNNEDFESMTMFGLLCRFVEAASAAAELQKNSSAASYIFGALVLSTLPYITEYTPTTEIKSKLIQPLQTIFQGYKSVFSPGIGMSAILLKDEQAEDDGDDEEEEDDAEEDGDEASGQICDSLQELIKASQQIVNGDEKSRFCLPLDAPWKSFESQQSSDPESAGNDSNPVLFSEDKIHLSFPNKFDAIEMLLRGEHHLNMQCFGLDGIVFGRLPIFGSTPDPESGDDDADEMEGEALPINEQLKAFVEGYTSLDRYFVAETLRDCLVSHESYLSPAGVQHGSARSTAEELLSVYNIFSGEDTKAGLEYAILESLFALIAQSTEQGFVRQSFLSSVLLELTRLEPSRFSPALAVAMTNLFQDYLPALIPAARDNFSRWFAYHLINTEYQWPSAFWQAWEPYATSLKQNSRGDFVRRVLHIMADNVSDLALLTEECLANSKSLSVELLCRKNIIDTSTIYDDKISTFKAEICRMLWENNEDPTFLRDHLLGDSVAGSLEEVSKQFHWVKTDALISAVVDPAKLMGEAMESTLKEKESSEQMSDDQVLSKDVFMTLTDAASRYKHTIEEVVTSEAEKLSATSEIGKDDAITMGQGYLLRAVEKCCGFSSNLLEGIVTFLLQNGIVSGISVVRWALADFGDEVEAKVIQRWWFFTIDAVRDQLNALEPIANGEGMLIDKGSNESLEDIVQTAIEKLTKMLRYAVERVCSLLVSLQTEESRLNPAQVELLEGAKKLISSSKSLLFEFFARSQTDTEVSMLHKVHLLISGSEISGSSLASLCTAHETNKGVSMLYRSLSCS